MNIFSLKHRAARLMKPEDDGSAGGAAAVVDRGDTMSAGAPDTTAADAAAADAAKEAEAIRTAAEAGEDGKAKTDDAGGKGSMIPLDRHKTMLDKVRNERDAAVAALSQQAKGREIGAVNAEITAIEASITAKEEAYNQALIDGEGTKASALMKEIRAAERSMGDMKTAMSVEIAESRAIERVRFDTTVSRLEGAYPMLNPDHESFDKDQVAEVMDLHAAYVSRGMTASAALQKAVKVTMGEPTTSKQEDAVTITPRVDATALADAKRTEAATAKALDAAKRTPPNAAKVGLDGDKLGGGQMTAEMAMKLGQDKFAKLDEDTLSRMRGDVL